ncbi:MAG: response regulator [Pedobacter agri]|uniref:Response regulator n=1 Tax=Pedobacter agri TaxID=454586 RepID=A0A9X3DEF8_9SPHI|nr:response regulator [Pedobacter agri]MCX3265621.1 response regulator [Pedobacter agri]MDQ1139088.1 DNA-binding response OmpR family regulator [Pedobacter agri]
MKKKILIIDDDNDLQEIFPLMFQHKDYELKSLFDVEHIDQVIKDYLPDLILLDIWIGKIDGRVVCNYLKSHAETVDIPILLISAVEIDIDDVHCQPDAIMQKPFEMEELISTMDELLSE